MLGSLLKESAGIVGRRFFLDALVPSFAAGALAVVIVGSHRAGGLSKMVTTWTAQSVELKTVQVVLFFAVVAFLAILLSSTSIALTRFFEGYWRRPFSTFGKYWHRLRLRRLDDDQQLYFRYPPKSRPEEVMPTRLGNIFKSAELYPALRYGMDGVLFWPRLYAVLPDRVATGLGETRSLLERLLALSSLSGLFAIGTSAYLLVVRGPVLIYLGCLLGGSLVAHTCYLVSLQAAESYAEQVRAAFDVYRRDLAVKLHGEAAVLDRPQWLGIGQLWFHGIPEGTQLVPDEPPPAAEESNGARWAPTSATWWAALTVVAAGAGLLWLR
ncbi:hypothetical protein [Amycolatopsis sp. MEPSY49]|uniref:hypothetical protein n=1 Tax=Amycolatopsis sp. MEPSY49 TaxID=3151600 RepID=UPI003EF6F52C